MVNTETSVLVGDGPIAASTSPLRHSLNDQTFRSATAETKNRTERTKLKLVAWPVHLVEQPPGRRHAPASSRRGERASEVADATPDARS